MIGIHNCIAQKQNLHLPYTQELVELSSSSRDDWCDWQLDWTRGPHPMKPAPPVKRVRLAVENAMAMESATMEYGGIIETSVTVFTNEE